MRLAIACDEGLPLKPAKARKQQALAVLPQKRSQDDLNSDPRGACAYMNYSGRFECSMSRKIAVASPHHEAGDD